ERTGLLSGACVEGPRRRFIMRFHWIDPRTRRSMALSAVVLSLTGMVLADRGVRARTAGVRGERGIAAGPVIAEDPSPTSSVFDGPGASGRLAVSHGRLLASGTRPMHVEIRVRPDSGANVVEARAPVALVLVIDTSGSM